MKETEGRKNVATALKLSRPLNQLTEISDALSSAEAQILRRMVGKIILETDDIIRMVVRQYPALDPD